MIRKEEYNALISRLNDPQNAEQKNALPLTPNGYDLVFHLNRINDYIKHCNQADTVRAQLLELDYTVSLRKAKELMDQQGWK